MLHLAETHIAVSAPSSLAKTRICMFIHAITPQTHSVLPGKSREVAANLGLETLGLPPKKGDTNPHQKGEARVCRTI